MSTFFPNPKIIIAQTKKTVEHPLSFAYTFALFFLFVADVFNAGDSFVSFFVFK